MKSALFHVSVGAFVCIALANTNIFNNVVVDVTYDHYAEKPVDTLPFFLAMPFNSIVNLGYICMGLYWLFQRDNYQKDVAGLYMKDVFALMAIGYGPIQWVRLSTLRHTPAVLDQWFTLPIFAWVPVWIHFIEHGWRPGYAAAVELCSVLSYALALVHDLGFDVALVCHVAMALLKGVRVQVRHGDAHSRRYFCLAALSCSGFVILKLLDHTLAHYRPFQHLTGHFWSKVCDVLQFHYSFCFLTHFRAITHKTDLSKTK
ncbi:transmembrane protein 187 [Aplochiton taeniatus]